LIFLDLKAVAETLRNFGGASAKGTGFFSKNLVPLGACPPRKFFKFGPLKWHLQHSESTFCKKFQVFKALS
jgi:hypothetical protein